MQGRIIYEHQYIHLISVEIANEEVVYGVDDETGRIFRPYDKISE